MLLEERDLAEQAAHIDALLAQVESFPDPAVRDSMAEVIQGLLGLYGEGLTRMMEIVDALGDVPARSDILQAFTKDDLVAHLLLLHDLHPVDLETRVLMALEDVRPYLQSHGGNVELLGIEGDVARVRLQGSCSGCPSSTMTLKLAIEEAIRKAAPELERIEAEGVAPPPARPVAFLPISDLKAMKKPAQPQKSWLDVPDVPRLSSGEMRASAVGSDDLLFIQIGATLVAYRNLCPDCSRPLDGGTLRATELTCAGCGHRYDVQRAGRSLDTPQLYLQPVPLLVRDGAVQVTVGAANGA